MAQRRRSRRTGRVRTVNWRSDAQILSRLKVVEATYQQPTSRQWEIVNGREEAKGRKPISYEQLKTDREHLRLMLAEQREELRDNMQRHVDALHVMKASVWRSIGATPEGPTRATLYAVAL